MKRKLYLSILAMACSGFFFNNAFGQDNDVFEKGFTLKFQYTSAAEKFGNMDNYWENYADENNNGVVINGTNWTQNKAGFGLKIGTMFFLNSIDFHDQMRIGIDVTYCGFNYLATEMDILGTSERFNMHHIYFNPEVGPSFSYSPTDNMSIDVAFKFSPTIAFNVGSYDVSNNLVQADDAYFGYGFGLRYAPALYFRYQPLLVGIQYNMGSINQNIASDKLDDYKNRTEYGSLDVIFGFKF